ncbi:MULTISPECIES: SIR2 family NAD-dependent protein deacylase [Auritidibacter]|uniref:SIR2 family NAD-dependent protein deacylase n=1 Tax=Auritidibacter TaxID=1160973 RepID=UPI000D72E7C2|nr:MULTISPECIES: NAD-dependent deacylase [Auritidibacter]PXA77207.1 NAD-dependent deacylase [Auritidibacter sp. NML100628]WGH84762.1 NAD-dependent deacylase [Auritidibacter ignavus]
MEKTREVLADAEHIVVFSGAGISKESGLSTYREPLEGLWEKWDPQELATVEAMYYNPELVWTWMMHQAVTMRQATPNPAHEAVAEMQRRLHDVRVITQNVDDLHERGGATVLSHLHGQIATFRCHDCQRPSPFSLEQILAQQQITQAPTDPERLAQPLECEICTGYLRPDVVMFGEVLPQQDFTDALTAMQQADAVISVGTSSVVQPAASLPLAASRATLIEINPAPTELSEMADIILRAPAAEVMPQLVPARD